MLSSPLPMNTSEIHVYTCGAVLTANNLKTGRKALLSPKLYGKTHTESGRMKKKQLGQDL